MEKSETILIEGIKRGDKSIYSLVFLKYYSDLVLFAHTFLRDKNSSEELVQDVFLRLWEGRDTLSIMSSLKSYLLRSVQNKCIDYLRHIKIESEYSRVILNNRIVFENDTINYLLYSDLQIHLQKALDQLPDEITRAFCLNRFEGLTFKEISKNLNIPERTVESRIAKTLGFLREKLKDFLLTSMILLSVTM
jgi:RNA polymerase sigma-70 factor, ECF subfamily